MEADKLELEHIPFYLVTLVDDTVTLVANSAYKKGLELLCMVEPDVPDVVTGDPIRLQQVLTNLISNAIKFTNEGEISIFANIPNIQYQCPGKHPFILSRGPDQVHYEHASEALHYALEAVEEGTQLLICDEILDTLIFGLLKEKQVRNLIEKCKGEIELVMTGADASWSLIELADYVTEYKQIKHAYYAGAKARRGIEF